MPHPSDNAALLPMHEAVLGDPYTFYILNPDLAREILADVTPEMEREWLEEIEAARDALLTLGGR